MLLLDRKMQQLSIFAILTVIASAFAYDFPSFVTPCSRNAPDLNDCIKRNFEQAQPHFAEGIPKLFVPAMKKFNFMKIEMVSDNVKVSSKNVDFVGLHNVVLQDVQIDLPKKTFEFDFVFVGFEAFGNVDLQAKLLNSVISTNGYSYSNTTDFHVSLKFDAEEYVKKNKVYLKMKNVQVKTMNNGGFYLDVGNLHESNEATSRTINDFLNENQDTFIDTVSPVLESTFEGITARTIERIFSQIPYEELFPDK